MPSLGDALALFVRWMGFFCPPLTSKQISIYNKTYSKKDGRRVEKTKPEKAAGFHPDGSNGVQTPNPTVAK